MPTSARSIVTQTRRPAVSRLRNRIKRFLNRLKHTRTIATPFDKHDGNFFASVKLAAPRIWMRSNEPLTWCGR